MKKTKALINGNTGAINLVGWIFLFIAIAGFWFTFQNKLYADEKREAERIDERINVHPKIEKIDHQSELNGFNITLMMREFDIEPIE